MTDINANIRSIIAKNIDKRKEIYDTEDDNTYKQNVSINIPNQPKRIINIEKGEPVNLEVDVFNDEHQSVGGLIQQIQSTPWDPKNVLTPTQQDHINMIEKRVSEIEIKKTRRYDPNEIQVNSSESAFTPSKTKIVQVGENMSYKNTLKQKYYDIWYKKLSVLHEQGVPSFASVKAAAAKARGEHIRVLGAEDEGFGVTPLAITAAAGATQPWIHGVVDSPPGLAAQKKFPPLSLLKWAPAAVATLSTAVDWWRLHTAQQKRDTALGLAPSPLLGIPGIPIISSTKEDVGVGLAHLGSYFTAKVASKGARKLQINQFRRSRIPATDAASVSFKPEDIGLDIGKALSAGPKKALNIANSEKWWKETATGLGGLLSSDVIPSTASQDDLQGELMNSDFLPGIPWQSPSSKHPVRDPELKAMFTAETPVAYRALPTGWDRWLESVGIDRRKTTLSPVGGQFGHGFAGKSAHEITDPDVIRSTQQRIVDAANRIK